MPLPDKEREAMKLWDKGKRSTYIADKLDVAPSTVIRWAHKNGKKVRYPVPKKPTVDAKEVIRLRKKTMADGKAMFSHREIADLVDCSKSRVSQILKEAGM